MLLVTAICIGTGPLPAKEPVRQAMIGPCGFEGDRHATQTVAIRAGKRRGEIIFNERQWSAIGDEEMNELSKGLGVVLPVGALGENLRLSGDARLSHFPFGTRLRFPTGAVLLVSGQNFPCAKQAGYLAGLLDLPELSRSFIPAAKDLRGLVGWVETTGKVTVGDRVAVSLP